MKEPYSFKLEPEIIPALKLIAKSENRSLNNLVETVLSDFIQLRSFVKCPADGPKLHQYSVVGSVPTEAGADPQREACAELCGDTN